LTGQSMISLPNAPVNGFSRAGDPCYPARGHVRRESESVTGAASRQSDHTDGATMRE
jgi:hypothetical protein